jgi:iron complex outermembrane receptor protein
MIKREGSAGRTIGSAANSGNGAANGGRVSAVHLAAITFTAAMATAGSVSAADASADASDAAQLGKVVVTARNREEIAQDVPIPVNVIGGQALTRDNVVALEDLVKKVPGLQATTPNSRRTGISIRGIGKSAGNDALEASMGVIVDGVFLTHPGMTYQDYTDLDRVEILRGPQGTLLGKNTTIGALNYVSKAASFSPQASANVSFSSDGWGSHDTHTFNASLSNGIIDGLLAFRLSAFSDKQDGDIQNVNTEGGRTHEKNRSDQRLQLLLTPTDNFSAKLNLDYAESNERSNTKPVISVLSNYDDATNSPRVTTRTGTVAQQNQGKNTYVSVFQRAYFGGYTPIVGSWTQEDLNLNVPLLTKNQGAALTLDWQVAGVTLTSISAVRSYVFDAKNDADQTKFDTGRSGTRVEADQKSQEFRVAGAVGDRIDYQAGLYFLHSRNTSNSRNLYGIDSGAYSSKNGDYNVLYNTAAGKQLLQASLNRVYVQNITTPDTKSSAVFGQANWHFADKGTLTVGLRDTYEKKANSASKQASFIDGSPLDNLNTVGATLGASATEISSANNIRSTVIGTTYGRQQGQEISGSALSWLISPSYKLDENTLLYLSASSGQKSGSVQFTSTGAAANVNPEKVLDVELGVKTLLLDKRLMLNANLYQTRVKDYQQTTSIFDAATTALRNDGSLYYQSILGNIPGIRARDIELDSAFAVTRNLSVTLGASYNDAVYTDWHTATCPSELNVSNSTVVCDNTGKQIVAAPRLVSAIGVDYKQRAAQGYAGHAWLNNTYRTTQNFDNNLSRYGIQGAYALTDLGVGLISTDGNVEVDIVARNAFDKHYTTSINVGNDGSIGYDGIGARRWLGLVLHGKFK